MRMPGFTAERSLSKADGRYTESTKRIATQLIISNSQIVPAALARELSQEEMRACYFACRSGRGGLGVAFCAASCF